ncbi:Hypothetical predicted protein [Paramuricea clavata]|uniref:Uncharacterized protein n=1 Tax=Paramuricea clavata TaxID=317549 RepID=A0A6S7FRG4_PARCT|nr:Hypothetical predicted protein [Paramuricea clavata]
MDNDQHKFLINLGPCQPQLKSFPENEAIPKNKDYSQKEDKAHCFGCSLFPSGPGRKGSDQAWVNWIRAWHKMKSVGTNKPGKLVQHFSSASHQAALADFARFSIESSHIDVVINAQMKEILIQEKADEEKSKAITTILFDVARTLARQTLAFRGSGNDDDGNFIQIVHLLSRHCKDCI